ncbi:hypothetical protein [Jeotgalibacillus soli]|uniref:Multi-TM2 domain-containing protein n=1 Tax=Jeotgalibacillus soli TaxID=889306 RepID=A0A0C2SDJ4_9BACL|nr:hypothetical protein [Jeotgalibacillus soli]KIL52014.1 hypothetical protein KP78_03840 [Jeotgalibacillus soli]
MTKSPVIAFLLSIIPGWGHVYIGNIIRGFLYFFIVSSLMFGGVLLTYIEGGFIFLAISLFGIAIYMISFVDMIISLNRQQPNPALTDHTEPENLERSRVIPRQQGDSERFFTIILSFFPGLGHFQLGLMNRGLTFMTAFFGMAAMIFFVTILLKQNAFLLFAVLLPVIWIYSFVDSIQLLTRKQRGEQLEDRSVLEDFEERRAESKKSISIATALAIFPGAGHLYLGLQHRGIQLMAAFLFTIYILDALRLGLFLFIVPLIWFYSFFDGLQKASRYGKEELVDEPIFGFFSQYQRWLGMGLIFIGLYYLLFNALIPALAPTVMNLIQIDLWYWFDRYFQTLLLSVVIVFIGIKILRK